MKEIITDVEKLSMRAEEVDIRKEGDLCREIVLALKEVVRAKSLTCLAAPQIGYNKRIFVINYNGDVRTFINPTISEVKGFELAKETCPSIPDKTFLRIRHNNIIGIYQTPLGEVKSYRMVGMNAVVYQRMVDMLDGLLLSDVGLQIDQDFEEASEEERMEVINAYLDSLDLRQKEVEKEIEEDPDLKKMQDAANFIEKVQKGEVTFGKRVTVDKDGNIQDVSKEEEEV